MADTVAGIPTGPPTIVADTPAEVIGPPLHFTNMPVGWIQSLRPLGVRPRNRNCCPPIAHGA
jgi:hypothetical protein